MNICDLNDYSISHIFCFLTCDDLDRCILVCKRFYQITRNYVYLKKIKNLILTGGHLTKKSLYNFTRRKRLKLHENWRNGRYEEQFYFFHRLMYVSKIILDEKFLFMSHRGQIRVHERTKGKYCLRMKALAFIGNVRDADITCFAKEDDLIFAGRNDGSVFIYNCGNQNYSEQILHPDEVKRITSVDFVDDFFVTTTASSTTNFWRKFEELGLYLLEPLNILPDSYETIKICPKGTRIAGGKYHDRQKMALRLIDIETGNTEILNSSSHAIYHTRWKDENCIFTANFDTSMRVFDTRCNKDVGVWYDAYDASIYCLDHDGENGVLCGMKYNFRVNLYDLRMPERCVQMYFPSKKHTPYSPVYSLASDASQMFIVTDHDLRILNFNADWAEAKDYSVI